MHIKSRIYGPDREPNFLIHDIEISGYIRPLIYRSQETSKPVKGGLYVVTKAYRVEHIEYWKKSREDPWEAFDLYTNLNAQRYKFELEVVVNYAKSYGELSLYHEKLGHKNFDGTIRQIEDILSFLSPALETLVELGDKAISEFTDEEVFTKYELDYFQSSAEHSLGWEPDSPEQCSDKEREVFSLNE